MKQLDPNNCTKIGYYVYSLARNLLHAKRQLRFSKLNNLSAEDFHRGVELEAHNRYYAAKETFWEEIKKK